MNLSKYESMRAWLEENEGKTERDWLLEVRCPDDSTRAAVAHLLDALEKGNVNYGICTRVKNYYAKYQLTPISEVESIDFDLMIAPGDVGRCSYLFEMDMPDALLGQLTENRRGEAIPEEAYKWLLRQWFPDFDLTLLDERQYRKLMWEDLGGYLGGIHGNRGFPNWKEADFATNLVAKVASLRSQGEEYKKTMDNLSKYESMRAWLEENEGKTERDWLLEVRCTDDRQREELKEFFAWVDEKENRMLTVCPDLYFLKVGQQPGMPAFVNTVQTSDPTEEVQVECDFALYEMFYDLDAPESVYGQTHPWDYWKWKSDKMGLNDTNFAYQAYEYFDQMRWGIPHWNTWKDKQRY